MVLNLHYGSTDALIFALYFWNSHLISLSYVVNKSPYEWNFHDRINFCFYWTIALMRVL